MGIRAIDVNEIEVCLNTTFNPRTVSSMDDEFDFPQELLPILQRQVLELGRFVMIVPKERVNDASGEQQASIQKTRAVSDPLANVQREQGGDE
jgi:hypothetical protein